MGLVTRQRSAIPQKQELIAAHRINEADEPGLAWPGSPMHVPTHFPGKSCSRVWARVKQKGWLVRWHRTSKSNKKDTLKPPSRAPSIENPKSSETPTVAQRRPGRFELERGSSPPEEGKKRTNNLHHHPKPCTSPEFPLSRWGSAQLLVFNLSPKSGPFFHFSGSSKTQSCGPSRCFSSKTRRDFVFGPFRAFISGAISG